VKKHSLHPILNRRDFLKLVSVAGVTAAGAEVLYEYTPWLSYEQHVEHSWRPVGTNSNKPTDMRELIRNATFAANGHNSQPWNFAIKENSIEIHPDYTRRLPYVDPINRELWISLGCALENMLIAARAAGYIPEVTYPESRDFIKVQLTVDLPQPSPLFDAIRLRQTTRSEHDIGRHILRDELDQARALPLEPGVAMNFVLNPTDMEIVLEYVNQGNLNQFGDKDFINELIYWLRFTKKEAIASFDGLFSRCSGSPEVPRWLGQIFIAGANLKQQADADAKKLRSSSIAIVFVSETDDKTAWVRTGQVYERMALLMTSLGIKSAFLNQPIEVADLRSEFQSAMGLGSFMPQLLARFGYADPMLRSLRRPVEQVVVSSDMKPDFLYS
jgi:hypothetical protein